MTEKSIQQLKKIYGIALGLIALTILSSSGVLEYAIQRNVGDSRIINLAGRQRMLSQRLTKCVLTLDRMPAGANPTNRLNEITVSLAAWKKAHLGLQHGDEKLGLPVRQHSAQITALFASVEPSFTAMVQAFENLLAQWQGGHADPTTIHATAEVLLLNEPRFLEQMDRITFQFDQEADARIHVMQTVELFLLLLGLLILLLEFLLVFRPSLSRLALMTSALQQQFTQLQAINQRLQTSEAQARTSAELHRNILETAMDGFWLVDLQGRILEVNATYCRMSGYGEAELLALKIPDLDAAMPADEITATFQRIITEGEARFESQHRRKDGSRFDIEASGQYRPADKTIVAFIRDITKRKQAVEELRDSKRQLEGTIAELQQAQHQILLQERLRGLGQMASGIAHDFNNALSPIIGFSEFLLKHPEKLADHTQVTKWLTNIHTAATDAAGVVKRIREFSQQKQMASDALTLIDPNQLILQTIEITEPSWKDQAQATGRTVHIATDLQPLPFIVGEAFAIRELLSNLIFNALDAMPQGGTLTLSTVVAGGFVRLSVQDTGTGMTEEVRQRCLEPFFTTKGTEGTGLGLAMVSSIVKRHSGQVEIESTVGQGTTFIVRLPIPSDHAEPQVLTATPVLTRLLRVLVVDDEPLLCELVKELLSSDGHTVETVENGETALARLKNGSFDLVLTDKAMPQMNGEQLSAAINQSAPGLPVILMTGFGDIMKADGELPPHIRAILSKPITETALREVLVKVFPPQLPDQRRGV